MALKPGIKKRLRNCIGVVCQQLSLNSMNAGRLLQGLDHMVEQAELNLPRVGEPAAVGHIEIADHSLAAFVDKKRVTEDAAAVDRGVSRQDLGVNIAQDHLCRAGIVP